MAAAQPLARRGPGRHRRPGRRRTPAAPAAASLGPRPARGRPPQPPAPQPPKLDPADPAQRRARNAALAGPLALVCLFVGFHWAALFVGALGIVWGISALRTPKPAPAAAVTGTAHQPAAPNPLTPAALAGILTGAMTVVVATSVIGLGMYYNDYVTCVRDSLTSVGAENCDRFAPKWYVDFTGNAG